MKQQAHIFVRGLVQGVGFRPFIYIIANSHKLKGYVLNLGDAGVEILVEGEENEIKSFIEDIQSKKPLISRIDTMDVQLWPTSNKFNKFEIAKSDERHLTIKSVIPTDISICDICITDIKMKSRWNNYPFTSCAQCGPRFTMISKLPYDRGNTSMVDFPFCPQCEAEYNNPLDRRYDAQGITCPVCGPTLCLIDNQNNKIDGNPILETAKLIKEGNIIAIKGIGGFHIAADATDEEVVNKLRKRRIRPYQPFAVMSESISVIEKYAKVSFEERTLLTNIIHPIVTLTKSENYSLASSVSPNLNTIGVMLPYTGIHLLLLDKIDKDAIIMTSGNYPHKPIYIDNNEAMNGLNKIVDYYLMHNRQIINRCDDSVIKNIDNTSIFLRKSRGYAPSSIAIPWSVNSNGIISVGGEYNVTGSILMENRIVTTQHIGDINEVETLDFLKNALNFIMSIYNIQRIKKIAHDLNPSFLTTRYAQELAEQHKAEVVPVQHHHAHMASLMADNNMPKETSIVCIAIDGVGYGTDRMAWGGEILYGGYSHFERVGQLKYQPMPGGDANSIYPARMLGSILTTILDNTEINRLFEQKYIKYLKYGRDELDIILKQSRSSDVLKTSSMGRLLDSIATLLDVCTLRTYEGEPPMCLEAFALKGNPDNVTLRLPISQHNGISIFDTSEFMISIIEALDCCRKEDIAYEVHRTLGRAFAKVACKLCDRQGVSDIGLVGGSAVNSLLFNHIKKEINLNNKNFVFYKTIPPGDGGTSIGQAIIASVL